MNERTEPRPRAEWPTGLADLYADLAAAAGTDSLVTGIEFNKWRLLHKFVHAHPCYPDPGLPRGEQWRVVHRHIDAILGDPEILEWIAQQAEINENRARGLHDWRPRKDDPCHELLLEYVGNRKRTALAVHHFALAHEAGEGKGKA